MKQRCATFAVLFLCGANLWAQVSQPIAVTNGGFERQGAGKPKAWHFVCKNAEAQFEIVPVTGDPRQTVARIRVPGIRGLDARWRLPNIKTIPIEANQSYILSYRVKANCETRLTLAAEGWKGGKRTVRRLAEVRSIGPHQGWKLAQQAFVCPTSATTLHLAFLGTAGADILIDDVQIRRGALPPPPVPQPYNGSLDHRVRERMARALVALPCSDGVYIGWRMLASDADDISFNLYRVDHSAPQKRGGLLRFLKRGWRHNAVRLNTKRRPTFSANSATAGRPRPPLAALKPAPKTAEHIAPSHFRATSSRSTAWALPTWTEMDGTTSS